MEWQTVSFDWNQARAFLVTAEEGSLSAAARSLALTQPTLGRQVAALEANLGVTLFDRVGRSLALTGAGLELLEHVRVMGEAASRVSLTASGQSQTIEGQVCISASDLVAAYHLPPILERLRSQAPGIEVEVVASNSLSDLRRREADIAVRHVRPEHPELIAKHVRDTTAHFYASPNYLDQHGRPETVNDLARYAFVATGQTERYLSAIQAFGVPLTKDNFKFTSESGIVGWELVKQGLGVAIMSKDIADLTPDVENILPDFKPMPIPIWIVTHRELHTSRRIRIVFDLLADAFSKEIQVVG